MYCQHDMYTTSVIAVLTSSGLGFRFGFLSSVCQVLNIDVYFGMTQGPKEVLDLVFAVLVYEQFDKVLEPELGELGQASSRITEVWILGVQDV
jgi:hypothetical protein